MRRLTKLATVSVAAGAVSVGGLALASWGATGTGSGRASSLSAQSLTVSAATGAADLYPGFNDGDLYFTINNTNPYPVRFTSMSAGSVTSNDTSACPSSNVTIDPTATGFTLDVAANSTSGTLTIPNVVNMSAAAPDGCQGKFFTIVVTLSGAQN